jgi:hypothetical protein
VKAGAAACAGICGTEGAAAAGAGPVYVETRETTIFD